MNLSIKPLLKIRPKATKLYRVGNFFFDSLNIVFLDWRDEIELEYLLENSV